MRYFEFKKFEILWLKNGKFATKCEQIKKFQNVRKRLSVKKFGFIFEKKTIGKKIFNFKIWEKHQI